MRRCFEQFRLEGEKVPKLLPCGHTLCLGCIKQLREGRKTQCPECRKSHFGLIKDLPTNKYILDFLYGTFLYGKQFTIQRCEEHFNPWNLFCADPKRLKFLCPECPTQDHKEHKNRVGPFDSLDEAVDGAYEEAAEAMKNLQECVKKVKEMQKTVTLAGKTAKEEIDKTLGVKVMELVNEAADLRKNVKQKVEQSTEELEEIKQEALQNMKGKKILRAAQNFPDDLAWKTNKNFSNLAERLNSFKKEVHCCTKSESALHERAVTFVPNRKPLSDALGSVSLGPASEAPPEDPDFDPPGASGETSAPHAPHREDVEVESERVDFWTCTLQNARVHFAVAPKVGENPRYEYLFMCQEDLIDEESHDFITDQLRSLIKQ